MSTDDDKWVWEPVSLCPAAPGWRAVYDADTEPWWISEPVAMWGIYRQYNFYDRSETGDSDIFGVVPDGAYRRQPVPFINPVCESGGEDTPISMSRCSAPGQRGEYTRFSRNRPQVLDRAPAVWKSRLYAPYIAQLRRRDVAEDRGPDVRRRP